jgi:protease-4
MKKFIIGLFATIGVLSVLFVIGIFSLALIGAAVGKPDVPSKTILELDLEQPLQEHVPSDPAAELLMARGTSIRDVIDALARAAEDDRVVGLVAKIGAGGMGMAQAQEIRDAVAHFRASGKPAVVFSETFGEAGPGNVGYYLATAFDEVWLQPSGDVGLNGIMLEGQFLHDTLEKVGVEPRMDNRYEYKNAMNTFTETEFTEPHREALGRIAESWHGQIVAGIAETRGMDEGRVRDIIDRGPYLGQEAVDAGLVDRLAYRDEVYAQMQERVGGDADLLYAPVYLERAGRPSNTGRDAVALIYGVGAVARGSSGMNPLFGTTMGSDTVTAAFRAAIEDEDVKAIVFRIDSPGGSYVASDAIWRETIRARDAGKPVIATMGNVAGSGGYFVAMAADKILAQPGTITGSIGVLGGKFLTRDMWDKLGITFDEVHAGENALMYSSLHDYTPEAWQRHQAWLDRVYVDFTAKAAEGRRMEVEDLREVAKGRIWSGEDALVVGLVDELGGLPRAIELAREAAAIEPDDDVRIELFPREKTLFQQLMDQQPENSNEAARATSMVADTVESLQPLVGLARQLGIIERPGVLTMPVEPSTR